MREFGTDKGEGGGPKYAKFSRRHLYIAPILSEGSEGKEQSFINTCLPRVLAVHRPSDFVGLSFNDGTSEFIEQFNFGLAHQMRDCLQYLDGHLQAFMRGRRCESLQGEVASHPILVWSII